MSWIHTLGTEEARRDVLAICDVAAYNAYVDRIADGLGVQLEA